jgi:hypothetical protein
VAVDWHDCAWSPLIVMQSRIYSAGGDEIYAQTHRRTDAKRMKPDQSRPPGNDSNAAGKVARTSRPCVSVTGDNFAGTHRRDACATPLPEKSSQNARIFRSADSFVRVFLLPECHRADKAVRAPLVAASPRCVFALKSIEYLRLKTYENHS